MFVTERPRVCGPTALLAAISGGVEKAAQAFGTLISSTVMLVSLNTTQHLGTTDDLPKIHYHESIPTSAVLNDAHDESLPHGSLPPDGWGGSTFWNGEAKAITSALRERWFVIAGSLLDTQSLELLGDQRGPQALSAISFKPIGSLLLA